MVDAHVKEDAPGMRSKCHEMTRRILYVAHPGLNRVNLTKLATIDQGPSLTVRLII
jgi:hypothetical protein